MTGRHDDIPQLESLLRSLGSELAMPPAPDMRTSVRERLTGLSATSAVGSEDDVRVDGWTQATERARVWGQSTTGASEKSVRRQFLEMAAAALVVVVFTGLLALVYRDQAAQDEGVAPGTEDPTAIIGDEDSPRIPAIAYSRDDDGESILIIADIDGNVLREVRDLPQHQFGPERFRIEAAISPNGTQVVFENSGSDRGNLYARDLPDGEDRPLVVESGSQDSNPVWSPDGEWIAFERTINDHTEVYIVRPDGSDFRQLTETEDGAGVPVWSPDSQKIAYVSPPSWEALGYILDANPAEVTPFAIHVINADGTDQRAIAGAEIFEPALFAPSDDPGSGQVWSPDSQRIVFTVYEAYEDRDGASPGLAIADVESGSIEVIPDIFAISPAWSPDRHQIAFVAQEESDSASIFLYDVESGSVDRLIESDDWLGNPQWSPNGEHLKYSTDDGIYVVGRDGGQPKLVAEPSVHLSVNTWVWARRDDEAASELPTVEPEPTPTIISSGSGELPPPSFDDISTEDITITIRDDQMLALAAQRWVNDRRVMTVFDLDGNVLWEFDQIPNIEVEGFPSTIVAHISPDGRYVAYQHNFENDRSDIFVMDAEGGEPQQLTTTGDNYSPVWSPSGEQIAFISHRADPANRHQYHRGELFLMDRDGANQLQLTETPYGAGQARWSPDGSRIAAVSPSGSAGVHPINDGEIDEGLPIQLFVVDISSGRQTHLEDASVDHVRRLGLARQPWLTDGSGLLLERQVDDRSEVIVAWSDGQDIEVIEGVHAFQPGNDTPMTVSPDGRHVAFDRSNGQSGTLNLLDLETGEFFETGLPASNIYASWSPDGELITRLVPGSAPDDYPEGLAHYALWVTSPSDQSSDLVVDGVSGPAKWLVVSRE